VFKKTLIALSVGAALGSVNANAVTFEFTPNAWTTEGAELVNNFVVPNITVTLGAEYSKDDVITFEFNADVTGAFKTTIDVTNVTNGTMTLGYVSASANTVTYRVTELSADSGQTVSTVGAKFVLERQSSTAPNLVVGDDVRAADGLTATFSATTGISGLALDSTPAAVIDKEGTGAADDESELVTFVEQYATVAAKTKFDGEIDVDPSVGASRTVFSDGGTTDESTISVTEKLATNNALTTGLTVTLAGDFSFIQDADATTAKFDNPTGVLYGHLDGDVQQASFNEALTEASFTFALTPAVNTGASKAYDVGMFFDNSKNTTYVSKAKPAEATEMARGSFTATVDTAYAPANEKYTGTALAVSDYDLIKTTGDITSKEAGSVSAGAFTLNGASVTVYSMPINNAAVTNYLYVTNSGALPAEVSVSATTNGGTVSANDIVTVPAKSITNITEAVEMALASASGQRATVELTLNAPACNIVVSAAYKVGTDRLPLETSQTLDGKCDK
jgi:hypothetical protein